LFFAGFYPGELTFEAKMSSFFNNGYILGSTLILLLIFMSWAYGREGSLRARRDAVCCGWIAGGIGTLLGLLAVVPESWIPGVTMVLAGAVLLGTFATNRIFLPKP
jgi:hypothetical protein